MALKRSISILPNWTTRLFSHATSIDPVFLVDTNVFSELRKRQHGDPNVRAWFSAQPAAMLRTSPIVIAELEHGFLKLSRRDPQQAAPVGKWVNAIVEQFEGRVVAIDTSAARCFAALHVPDPRPQRDAWIAATALVNDLVVATRNLKDFTPMGAKTLNPWTFQST
jgi:toxin FitB